MKNIEMQILIMWTTTIVMLVMIIFKALTGLR